MSFWDVLCWIMLPYAAITVFIVGHVWRYRTDQFNWTSRSTQLLDRKTLGWASPAFHYGALAAIGGHVIGLCIPESWTHAVGISEGSYVWIAGVAGGVAGLVTLAGFLGLLYRRTTSVRVRQRTSWMDIFTYLLLTVLILMGCWMTFGWTLFTDDPYNYRGSIAEWWRSLFYFDPDVEAVHGSPFIYQLHAIVAWLFWGTFAFSRLVHAWSIPLQYLGRPYILYRSRSPQAEPMPRRAGEVTETTGRSPR
ncbi:MAG: respiratory nitrate reductase subunit gamma [Solirubrobacterales bacterium]|nr:respiratory nitrate reductase subunit gamma [Solirubrobacterales bacterium]